MRYAVAALFALTIATTAHAQTGQWLPGLDIIVPGVTVWKDQPGAAVFGYDRDTRHASVMFPKDGCYWNWWISPAAGRGAITHAFVFGFRQIAVYYESGFMQVETVPDANFCIPL
jgi:hypothetical protein